MDKVSTIVNPILITGVERSGSTIIARVLDMCGVWRGSCNNMFENTVIHSLHYELLKNNDELFPITERVLIPFNWKELIIEQLYSEGWDGKQPWVVKGGVLSQYWPVWNYAFPDAKWLIVRRRTGDIIQSCTKTGYMRKFKNKETLHLLGLDDEADGWRWYIHQYENKFVEMMQAGLNCRVVWPDRMVPEPVFNPPVQYQQIYETIKWLGLEWSKHIPEVISPLLDKGRR
jgi:hypothetical protein